MAKIAFLGIGMMGSRMASRLIDAGHELVVWNRTFAKCDPLAERGVRVADTPAATAEGIDIAITMLRDAPALEAVLFGEDGLAPALSAGQVLVDMSTVGPDTDRSVAARLPDGVEMADAPVRGSTPQAEAGELLIYAGASDAVFARVEPILRTLGSVRHIGRVGTGQEMKLVVNLGLCAAMAALGEAMSLGDSFGLDRTELLEVLAASPLGATVTAKRANLEAGTYPSAFKLELADKDMRLVSDAARRAGRELRVADATLAWLDDAMADGEGPLDFSAVVATILGEEPRG